MNRKATAKEAMIQKFEQQMTAEFKILKQDMYHLQMDVLNKHYYNIEELDPLGKLLIETLTGKLGVMNTIGEDTGRIIAIMKQTPLPAKDLYTVASKLLRGWIEQLKKLGQSQKKNAASTKGKAAKETLIRAFFTELLERILFEDLLLPLRHEIYPEKRQLSKRTTCNAECLDGHSCQHIVWEGWTCWQHGGSYWGIA